MIEKKLFDAILKKLDQGQLEVTYWDGEKRLYGNPNEFLNSITLHDKAVVRKFVKNISIGFGEAYMDGSLEVHTPLDKLLALGFANLKAFDRHKANRTYKKFNSNIKRLQPRHISYHYDLGNDFYELWLDKETLGYTCSYFKTPGDTLEQGQIQKFDHVLNKLQLQKASMLLDIGFGWGYLLIRAAKRFGVRGLGVSLSKEQLAYARDWAKREKVDDLVQFELMNYQDLPNLGKKFDRIVSVGFFEHVGRGQHSQYFDTVSKMLAPEGVSVLHCITQQVEEPVDPWLDKYIFPGGYCPSSREVMAHFPRYGFVVKDYENIGPHYIKTLGEWWERFETHKDQIINMYDERFYRMWRLYLAGSQETFRSGGLHLSQWTFTRVPALTWPLTREYIYED